MSSTSPTQTPLPDSATGLAESIASIASGSDNAIDRDAVLTALGAGLACFFTKPPCRALPVLAECHDFALPEVAELFGIHLRAMHPPRARHGLAHSAEFADHFVDSYVPLIQRALQNGQKVLTFQGWSPEVSATWGVVDRSERDGGALWGRVPSHTEPVQLSRPALQCYVIEQVEPGNPEAFDVLARGATNIVQLGERGTQVYPGLTGVAEAFDQFASMLKTNGTTFPTDDLRDLIGVLQIRKEACVGFLSRNQSTLAAHPKANGKALLDLCKKSAESLKQLATMLTRRAAGDSGDAIQAISEWVENERHILHLLQSMQPAT